MDAAIKTIAPTWVSVNLRKEQMNFVRSLEMNNPQVEISVIDDKANSPSDLPEKVEEQDL